MEVLWEMYGQNTNEVPLIDQANIDMRERENVMTSDKADSDQKR